MNFENAQSQCSDVKASLAYPVDEAEDEAVQIFLQEHFNGDQQAVATGLGAWMGIIKPDGFDNFTYADTGEIADYLPFMGFSRLVGEWDVCASYAYGFQFDQSVGDYVQKLKWDEAFCAKTKMPLCMIGIDFTLLNLEI